MRLVLHTPGVVEGEEQTVVQLCESGQWFFYVWTTSTYQAPPTPNPALTPPARNLHPSKSEKAVLVVHK